MLTSSGQIYNWISKYVFEAFLKLKNPSDFTLPPPPSCQAYFAAAAIGTANNQSLLLLLYTNVNPSRDIFFIFISSSGTLPHYFSSEETDGAHSV